MTEYNIPSSLSRWSVVVLFAKASSGCRRLSRHKEGIDVAKDDRREVLGASNLIETARCIQPLYRIVAQGCSDEADNVSGC